MKEPAPTPRGEPAIRTIAMPADANPAGDIFGGWLMAQMDLAAGNVAARRARSRCATVSVDRITFDMSFGSAFGDAKRAVFEIRTGSVDEPSTLTLLGLAIGGAGLLRRRRCRRR